MLYQKMSFPLKKNIPYTSYNRTLENYNVYRLSKVDYICKIISHWILDFIFFPKGSQLFCYLKHTKKIDFVNLSIDRNINMVQMEDGFSLRHAIFYDLFEINRTKAISISMLTPFCILAFLFLEHLYLKTKILDSVKGQTV